MHTSGARVHVHPSFQVRANRRLHPRPEFIRTDAIALPRALFRFISRLGPRLVEITRTDPGSRHEALARERLFERALLELAHFHRDDPVSHVRRDACAESLTQRQRNGGFHRTVLRGGDADERDDARERYGRLPQAGVGTSHILARIPADARVSGAEQRCGLVVHRRYLWSFPSASRTVVADGPDARASVNAL